jgi:signal transduction histidine kinase
MTADLNVFSLIYLAASLLGLLLGGVAWRRRRLPGASPFALLMLAVCLWSLFYALESIAATPADKILWAKFQYIGVVSQGVLWFTFAYKYTRRTYRWPGAFYWLWLPPLAALALVFTNEYHGLAWPSIVPGLNGLLVYDHGPAVLGIVTYDYLLAIAGVVLLLREAARRPRPFSAQSAVLAAGALLPVAINLVYLLKLVPVPGLDITPLSFLVSGFLYIITIFRLQLFDVVPLARDRLVENLLDGVVVLDAKGRVADFNPAAKALTGASEVSLSQPWGMLMADWPSLAAIPVNGNGDILETARSSDGNRVLEVRSAPIFNRRRLSGRLVVIRDITERQRAQEIIESSLKAEKTLREELQGEIRNRSEYTRALIHELRTPLTALVASTELLGDLVHEGTAGALVSNVARASANLNQRIGELVEMAKGEIGLLKLTPEPFDLAVLLRHIIEEMTPLADRQNLTLVSQVPDGLPLAMGEGPRVRQVVVNLLSNSFKFTAAAGVVRVKLEAAGPRMLRISVQDSGRGMSEEELKYLFDPYHRRPHDKDRLGGLGIGLALSKMLVELHGGTIQAQSEAGMGTTISFTVPVAPEDADPGPASAAP